MSRKALDLLTVYEWPGSLRELKNEVDRAVLLATDGRHLERNHFGPVRFAVEHVRVAAQEIGGTSPPVREALHLQEDSPRGALHCRVDAVKRQAIAEALRSSRGNKSRAAQILEITRNGLALKVKRLGPQVGSPAKD